MTQHRTIFNPVTRRNVDIRVAAQSYLEPASWLSAQQKAQRVKACEDASLLAAINAFGDEQEYIVRGLEESDFNVTTTKDWRETTSGAGAWAAAAFALGTTTIFDNLIIGIYGAKYLNYENIAGVSPGGEIGAQATPVTALRIIIAGKRVAQWDLSWILQMSGQTADLATTDLKNLGLLDFPDGFARTPVVITKEKTVEVDFWEGANTIDFAVALLGIVVEPVGGGQAGLSP